MNGVNVAPAKSTLFKEVSVTLNIKDGELTVQYENTGAGKRTVTVNGKTADGFGAFIKNGELRGRRVIVKIID